jgi:alcohol dehydrogenase (cytochrome c)
MPAITLDDADLQPLITYLRTLRPRPVGFQPYRSKIELTSGQTLSGLVVGESFTDAQMRTDDKQIHLLRRESVGKFREVTSEVNWPSYNGDPGGNRYTTLTQIDRSNVKRVAPRWIFTLPDVFPLEGTPVVMDGVMYVTSANECYALDAGSGRQIWHYHRDRTKGLNGIAGAGMNRGAAISGNRVFMATARLSGSLG